MSNQKLREIQSGVTTMTPFKPSEIGHSPSEWLRQNAQLGMILLAHTDSAIIWGKVISGENGEKTVLSSSPQELPLSDQKLIMARLFDEEQELFLWQIAEGQWRARLLQDGEGDELSYFDEPQILWGNDEEKQTDDFVYLAEGADGKKHAPPLELQVNSVANHKTHLTVRHYLKDDDGWLRVAFSRLVKPQTEEVAV